MLTAACQTVVSVALVLMGLGVFGVAVASPVSAIVGTVVLVRIGPKALVLPNFALQTSKHLLGEGSWFASHEVVLLVRDQGLNVVLAGLGGLSTLGVWALAGGCYFCPMSFCHPYGRFPSRQCRAYATRARIAVRQ